jgi:very-short-patch-repair endonuclease
MERRRVRGASREVRDAAREMRKEPTPQEDMLWRVLRAWKRGFKFRRQHPIGQMILDFYCPAARLCIEVDGAVHESADQVERDQARTAALEAAGIRVIRFRNEEIEGQMERTIRSIGDALHGSRQ